MIRTVKGYCKSISLWRCSGYRAHLWIFFSPLSWRKTIIVKVIVTADIVPTYGYFYSPFPRGNYCKSHCYCRYCAHLWIFSYPLSWRKTIIVKVIVTADIVHIAQLWVFFFPFFWRKTIILKVIAIADIVPTYGVSLPPFLKENNYCKSPWYCRYRAHLWVFLSPLSWRKTIIVKVIGIADFVPTYWYFSTPVSEGKPLL